MFPWQLPFKALCALQEGWINIKDYLSTLAVPFACKVCNAHCVQMHSTKDFVPCSLAAGSCNSPSLPQHLIFHKVPKWNLALMIDRSFSQTNRQGLITKNDWQLLDPMVLLSIWHNLCEVCMLPCLAVSNLSYICTSFNRKMCLLRHQCHFDNFLIN